MRKKNELLLSILKSDYML